MSAWICEINKYLIVQETPMPSKVLLLAVNTAKNLKQRTTVDTHSRVFRSRIPRILRLFRVFSDHMGYLSRSKDNIYSIIDQTLRHPARRTETKFSFIENGVIKYHRKTCLLPFKSVRACLWDDIVLYKRRNSCGARKKKLSCPRK